MISAGGASALAPAVRRHQRPSGRLRESALQAGEIERLGAELAEPGGALAEATAVLRAATARCARLETEIAQLERAHRFEAEQAIGRPILESDPGARRAAI
jgi:hypothetical protein